MKKVKDPVLFRKIKTFLTEYLPVIRKRSKNTISSYKAAINIYLSFIQYKTQKQLYEITIKDFTAENIQEFMDWLKVENNNTAPTINSASGYFSPQKFIKEGIYISSEPVEYPAAFRYFNIK